MQSQETHSSPEMTMTKIFCTFEKSDHIRQPTSVEPETLFLRPPIPVPTLGQINGAYIKNIINAVKWSDIDSFVSLLTPDTVHYAYLYEYGEIPLIEYLFVQYQNSKTGIRQRNLLKMALHLSTLIDKRDSNNFYDALGYTKKQVETVCQET